MSLVFYDTETTGTSAPFDQILQFAAVLTDADFNELDRLEMRCRVQPHIVPAPMAMLVTKVRASQVFSRSLPSHYEMVCSLRKKLLSWAPATFVGWNSIDFDEHLLRQALYQSLHPPYLTNRPGNARSDIMKIAQASAQFAPNAIVLPLGDKGQQVFKLGLVAAANGFQDHHAHDAMGDVKATIHMAKLLANRAPGIWSAAMRFGQKASAIDFLSSEPIICFGDHFFGKPYAWTVTGLGSNQDNTAEYFVFDLAVDPSELEDLNADQLTARLKRQTKPVRAVKVNAGPIFVDYPQGCSATTACNLSQETLQERVEYLQSNTHLCDRLIEAFIAGKQEYELSAHVEEQIYNDFTSPADQLICEQFHSAPWEQREKIIVQLRDVRLQHLGRRLIGIERPDVLSPSDLQAHDSWHRSRLLGDAEVPWLTLTAAIQNIDEMLLSADGDDAALLTEHKTALEELLGALG